MENFYKIRDMLCDELDAFGRKSELNRNDLDILEKIVGALKNMYKIEMYDGEDGGYSRGGDWDASIRGTYGRGNSYASRGKHLVRGHYSRTSGHDGLRAQLDDMIRETDDERVKEALRRAMSMVEG